MAAVDAVDISKFFEVDTKLIKAVDHLSFSIPTGQIVAILGPNGAGKTTTVRLLASILPPTSGTMIVNDLDVTGQPLSVRATIGISHERPSFYERLTGRRNLAFYAELYDVPKDQIMPRIDELSSYFDLDEAIDHPVGSYSKGMQQKLSVAKSLLHDPPLLVLDEPWSGLSPEATRDLRRKIMELGEQGKTILITTHNLAQAEMVADQLFIISRGHLIASGTPAQLRELYELSPQIKIRLATTDGVKLDNLIQMPEIIHAELHDQELLLEITSFEQTPQIINQLVKQGMQIREIRENIPSLEDVYLRLVEGSS